MRNVANCRRRRGSSSTFNLPYHSHPWSTAKSRSTLAMLGASPIRNRRKATASAQTSLPQTRSHRKAYVPFFSNQSSSPWSSPKSEIAHSYRDTNGRRGKPHITQVTPKMQPFGLIVMRTQISCFKRIRPSSKTGTASERLPNLLRTESGNDPQLSRPEHGILSHRPALFTMESESDM